MPWLSPAQNTVHHAGRGLGVYVQTPEHPASIGCCDIKPVNDPGFLKSIDGLGEWDDSPISVEQEFELILLRRVRFRFRARFTF
jgi:hypothetical protein